MERRTVMDFELDDYPKNDILKLIRLLCVDIFQLKLVRFLIFFALIFYVIIAAFQSYEDFYIIDGHYLMKYIHAYFISYFFIVAFAGNLTITLLAIPCLKLMQVWKIQHSKRQIEKRIKTEAKILSLLVAVNTLFATISGFSFTVPIDVDPQAIDVYILIEKYAPNFSHVLSWIYRVLFILIGFTIPSNMYQVVYISHHVRFQLYLLIDKVQHINSEDVKSLGDQQFQKTIKEDLVIIIKRHSEIMRVFKNALAEVKLFVPLYALVAVLLGISVLLFSLSSPVVQTNKYFACRIASLILTGIGTTVLTLSAGQQFEQATLQVFEACCCLNWYTWNRENRLIYVVMLENMRKPFRFQFSDSMVVNYQLGLGLLKMIYSTTSVLISMRK